jgi:polyferredoxin
MEDLFGGSPAAVALRLAIISLILGIVLAALGLEPFDVVTAVRRLITAIYNMGFGAVEKALGYFLTGAIIVVPIWLVARAFAVFSNKRAARTPPDDQ